MFTCVPDCICVYVCKHTCLYLCLSVQPYTPTIYIYVCIYMYKSTYLTKTYLHTYPNTQMSSYMHTYTNICVSFSISVYLSLCVYVITTRDAVKVPELCENDKHVLVEPWRNGRTAVKSDRFVYKKELTEPGRPWLFNCRINMLQVLYLCCSCNGLP